MANLSDFVDLPDAKPILKAEWFRREQLFPSQIAALRDAAEIVNLAAETPGCLPLEAEARYDANRKGWYVWTRKLQEGGG